MQDHDLWPSVDISRNNPNHYQGEALATIETSLHVLDDLSLKLDSYFEPFSGSDTKEQDRHTISQFQTCTGILMLSSTMDITSFNKMREMQYINKMHIAMTNGIIVNSNMNSIFAGLSNSTFTEPNEQYDYRLK